MAIVQTSEGPLERYTAKEWGRRGTPPKGRLVRGEAVNHTFAMLCPPGLSVAAEMALMRSVDRYHRETRRFTTIGYTEAVMPSGRVYEGRGPGADGGHTQQGRNLTAYGFAGAGHGDLQPWTPEQWQGMARIQALYRDRGWLLSRSNGADFDHAVTSHSDYASKTCAGLLVRPWLWILNPAYRRTLRHQQPTPVEEDHEMAIIRAPKLGDKAGYLVDSRGRILPINGAPVLRAGNAVDYPTLPADARQGVRSFPSSRQPLDVAEDGSVTIVSDRGETYRFAP